VCENGVVTTMVTTWSHNFKGIQLDDER